ncbi:MAG: BMP family ABC transporter substrate-binding protein [Notoacmeibacter sp.]|nr:BMP family ABC transporter substrate-binding protein [Notoacmeibacter sp.]
MNKYVLGFTTALALSFAGAAQAADKYKACFVYVGSKTDGGWTQAHEAGRQYAQDKLGDAVETVFVENVPEGPDAERAIERFARSGCGIIFTTSFGFMDPTLAVAAKFPDVKFEHATGYKTAANVTTYNSRFYQGRYIIGQIAGKVSKTGTAGYIASFPIPEVVMGINSFLLGAQSVNPDFKLKVVWVNTWFDAGKEADAAKALIDQGVDILTQHTDSIGPMQVAEERGIKAFGQAFDQIKAGPNTQMSAILDTWGPYYEKRIKMAMDGTWKGGESSWDGLKDGILAMAPYTNMPDDVKEMAQKTEAAVADGSLHPFTGPIMKQDGTEWLKAGEVSDDGTLLGMNFYVKGVDDKLPQ